MLKEKSITGRKLYKVKLHQIVPFSINLYVSIN